MFRRSIALEKIYYVPINQRNFDKSIIATPEQRVEMLRLSLEDKSHIIDDREINRSGTSYTHDTILSIKNQSRFSFISLLEWIV